MSAKVLRSFSLGILGVSIMSGIIAFMQFNNFTSQFKPVVQYETASAAEYQTNRLLKGNIYAALDSFAYRESWDEDTLTGRISNKHVPYEYFIIPAGEYQYIAIQVSDDDLERFYALSDATYNYLMYETDEIEYTPIYREALIEDMETEIYGYMVDWFVNTEFLGTTDRNEISKYILPYTISVRDNKSGIIGFYVACAFSVAFLALLIFLNILAKKQEKKNRRSFQE